MTINNKNMLNPRRLSSHQNDYIQKLTQELFHELTFLKHALAGRVTHRSDFADKLLKLLGATSAAASALTTLGVGLPAIYPIKVSGLLINHGVRYLRTAFKNQVVAQLMLSTDTSEDAIHILLNEVAREAAYKYEYALNYLIAPEGIDVFATIGALRIFDYFIRNNCTVLNKENLLNGLVEGNSGAAIYTFTNNAVIGNNGISYAAEDLYARCAYRTPDGQVWVNHDATHPEIQQRTERYVENKFVNGAANSHFGWVKLDDTGKPLTGYRWATSKEVAALDYQTIEPPLGLYKEPSSFKMVEKLDFENYMSARQRGYFGSFNDYIGAVARFDQELSDIDLTGANFNYADFTDAVFKNCNFNHCHFEYAYLTRSIWINTNANYLRAEHTHCAYMQAPEINFEYSDFTNAYAYKANFEGANFTNCYALPNMPGVVLSSIAKGGTYPENARHIVDRYEKLETTPSAISTPKQLLPYLGFHLREIILKHYKAPTDTDRNSPPFRKLDFAIAAIGELVQNVYWKNNVLEFVILVKKGKTLSVSIAQDIEEVINKTLAEFSQRFNIAITHTTTFVNEGDSQDFPHRLAASSAHYLGGNATLFTKHIDHVKDGLHIDSDAMFYSLLKQITQTKDTLLIQTQSEWKINYAYIKSWISSIYFLAAYQGIEWDSPHVLMERLCAKKIINTTTLSLWKNLWDAIVPCLLKEESIAPDKVDHWLHQQDLILYPWFYAFNHMLSVPNQLSLSHLPDHALTETIWLKLARGINPTPALIRCYWACIIEEASNDPEKKETIIEHVKLNYKNSPQSLKQHLLSTLEKIPATAVQQALFNHLQYIHQADGWFYAMESERQKWLKKLQRLFTTASIDATAHVRVPSEIQDSDDITVNTYDLLPVAVNSFLKPDGKFKPKAAGVYSLHPVYRINAEGIGWVRFFSEEPAIETATIGLLRKITGGNFWPQTLVSCCDIPGRATPIVMQWSEDIRGISLKEQGVWDSDLIRLITPDSFIAQLFADLTTGPGDNTENDYFLVPTETTSDGKKLYDLKRIDLERNFFQVEKKQTTLGFSHHKTLQIQSLLLCLPQMQQNIDLNSPVIQRFLQLDIYQLIGKWVSDLIKLHKAYQSLFTLDEFIAHFNNKDIFTKEEVSYLFTNQSQPQFSFLSVPIGGVLVKEIYSKLILLQNTLLRYYSSGEPLSPLQLTKAVDPTLYNYYKQGFQDIPDKEAIAKFPATDKLQEMFRARFSTDVSLYPSKSVTALLRFWYLTKNLRRMNIASGSQRHDISMSAVLSSVRLDYAFTLEQAQRLYRGEENLPHPYDAKKMLKLIFKENAQRIIGELFSAVTPLNEVEKNERLAQFKTLPVRYKKDLIKILLSEHLPTFTQSFQYKRLIELMQDIPYLTIDLSVFADELTDKMLADFLSGPNIQAHLQKLTLTYCTKITIKGVDWIKETFPKIQLKLSTELDAALKQKRLEETDININNTSITDAELMRLIKAKPKLKTLVLQNCSALTGFVNPISASSSGLFSYPWLAEVCKLKDIKEIKINACQNLNPELLKTLPDLWEKYPNVDWDMIPPSTWASAELRNISMAFPEKGLPILSLKYSKNVEPLTIKENALTKVQVLDDGRIVSYSVFSIKIRNNVGSLLENFKEPSWLHSILSSQLESLYLLLVSDIIEKKAYGYHILYSVTQRRFRGPLVDDFIQHTYMLNMSGVLSDGKLFHFNKYMKLEILSKDKELLKTLEITDAENIHFVTNLSNLVAVVCNDSFILLNPDSGLQMKFLHQNITQLICTPCGRVASHASDGTTILWDLRNQALSKRVSTSKSVTQSDLTTSPGGFVIVDENEIIEFHTVRDKRETKKLYGFPFKYKQREIEPSIDSDPPRILVLVAMPNGWVASGAYDGRIQLWDVKRKTTERLVAILNGHKSRIVSLVVSPEGQLISASQDGIIKIWPLFEYILEPTLLNANKQTRLLHNAKTLLEQGKLRVEQVPLLFPANLSDLDLSDTYITDDLLKAILLQCPRLNKITVEGCGWLTDEGYALINQREARCTQVPTLAQWNMQNMRQGTPDLAAQNMSFDFYRFFW